MPSLQSFTPRSLFAILFLLCSLQIKLTAAFAQCYYPDGSIPTDYIWEPCTGAEFSSCCIPAEGDICQDNGLCFYPGNNHTFRGACTDRTWTDAACPQDICVTGFEDTWQWATSCSKDGDSSFACGKISEEDGNQKTGNCTAGATEFTNFRTEALSTSKPTRYTPPPTLDPSLYTLFTSKYTTVLTANQEGTTVTTTWESTITSTFSHSSSTRALTGTAAGITSGASSSSSTESRKDDNKGKVTISAGVLAGAIAGPVILLGLLAGLFFFLRKRRVMKKDNGSAKSLDSSPPPNGPVGSDQIMPYEVSASEAKQPGVGDKHLYTGITRRNDEGNNAYEIGTHNEKGWYGNHNAAEVEGDLSRPGSAVPSPQQQQQYHPYLPGQQHLQPGVRSPAPVYSENNGPAVMPIELDGTDSLRGRRT